MNRSIASLARSARICLVAAVDALRTAHRSTTTIVALVTVSVLVVVGTDHAFLQLADLVARLADGGTRQQAIVVVDHCPRCATAMAASVALPQLVEVSSRSRITVRRVGAMAAGAQHVPLRCVPTHAIPAGIRWRSPAARYTWNHDPGAAGVLVGNRLAPAVPMHAPPVEHIRTTAGEWPLLGVLPERPLLSADAGDNQAILVPWRAPFATLCARGRVEWRIVADTRAELHHRIALVTEELRTRHRLRPTDPTPWQVRQPDRFAEAVSTLVRRFRRWVLAVPVAIAVLCGAGIFSVQTLEGAARLQEFGVRRVAGATRHQLVGQLICEVLLACLAGVLLAVALLIAAGLAGLTIGTFAGGIQLAFAVALPLCAVGVLVPGVVALRSTSIAGLEGRGPA